jgi:hypothetical protein
LSDWKRKVTAEYVPTDAQRSVVESASAFGITQAEIATQLKICEPTLRRTKVSLAGRLTATASIHQFPASQMSDQISTNTIAEMTF